MTRAERAAIRYQIRMIKDLQQAIDDYLTFHKNFPITIRTVGTIAALSLVKGCLQTEIMCLNRSLVL
jgi:hypothetical protein